jgi:hypothetical protein
LIRCGYALDRRASTAGARKYRRGAAGEVVVVVHGGLGWFDPLRGGREGRGDVLTLAMREWGLGFSDAVSEIAGLAGLGAAPPTTPAVTRAELPGTLDAPSAWGRLSPLLPGSAGWRYLTEERSLPAGVLRALSGRDLLREGVAGTVCAKHQDVDGAIAGWEMRGPRYKGYSRGGRKGIFMLAPRSDFTRVAVAEGFIDAISLGVIEGWPRDTAYIATDGGFGVRTEAALRGAMAKAGPWARVSAASDSDEGGDHLAGRVAEAARSAGATCTRLCPEAADWNEILQRRALGSC